MHHDGLGDLCWVYPKEDPTWKESIVKEFKIHPVTAQVLVSRGFTTFEQIHQYLYAKLPDLHDPFLLAEMDQAVERICQAIDKKEGILIYGDNDVDGMAGTALLTEFLQTIGANVFFYVSNRSTQRQSLIIEAVEYALQNKCKLLITVDCGITAAVEIAKVVDRNIDVIITDHHEPTDTMPHCVATLNPKLLNSTYPNRDLTGVGVAFKLAHAITNQFVAEGRMSPNDVDLERYLDLVALGTISDMGMLLGENRILVRYGLQRLKTKKSQRVGLAKLVSVCGLELNDLSSFSIASKVAPRLNSLGRIDVPQKGVEILLMHGDVPAAEQLATELDLNNIERQKIERIMSVNVDTTLKEHPEILKDKAVVMSSDKWHLGVIAIVSTRIAKQYNRPTIMIAIEKGIGKGSLRSIPQFPLLSVLKDNADLLINFGGHDFAAGLSIKEENIEEFKRRFIKAANEKLTARDVMPKLFLDAEVKLNEINFDLLESMRLLEPYGNENPQPILYSRVRQVWPPKVIGKSHLKLYLKQASGANDHIIEGIAFNKAYAFADLVRNRDEEFDVAFTPQINRFPNKEESVQLMIWNFQLRSRHTAPTDHAQ